MCLNCTVLLTSVNIRRLCDWFVTDFDVERPEHLDDLISLAKPIRSKGTRPKQPKKIVDNVKDKKTTIKDMKRFLNV